MTLLRPLRGLTRPARRLLTTTATLHRRRHRLPSTSLHQSPTLPYTPDDLQNLRSHYNNHQLAGLLSGESTISPHDFLHRRPRPDWDPMKLQYLDDLNTFDPLLDFPAGPQPYVTGHPLQPLPRMKDSTAPASSPSDDRRADLDVKRYRTKILVSHSVTNQTHMGKIRKIYCLAVAGNGDGLVGIGEGKSVEHLEAQRIATYMAVRNMAPVPRYEGRTIYGDLEIKVGAVVLKLFSRPPGFGLRVSQYVFEIARCLGLQDLSAKVTRSRNPMNVCKATIQALRSQKLPETIARGRGMKLVDVRKVYYNGAV